MKDILSSEIIEIILIVVVIPILSIITKWIVAYIKLKIKQIEQKIKEEKCKNCISIAEDIVLSAVISVAQTYVDCIKSEGCFDQGAKNEAFEMARQRAREMMSDSLINILEEEYEDADAWLDNRIEYYVKHIKELK